MVVGQRSCAWLVAGASDDSDGLLGSGQDDYAEPPAARSTREEDRGHRERVRRGDWSVDSAISNE